MPSRSSAMPRASRLSLAVAASLLIPSFAASAAEPATATDLDTVLFGGMFGGFLERARRIARERKLREGA
jgi:hypothetical protein